MVPVDPAQKDVAVFVTDLAAAHINCKDKLLDVKKAVLELKELYADDVTGTDE